MLAGLALAGALALSACGGASLDPVAKAATKTSSKGSEHIELTGKVGVAGQTVTMSGQGDFQNDPQLGSMTVSMQGPGQRVQMDEVMQGWTVYMRSPLFTKSLPAGKTWLSLDLQSEGKKLGIDFSQFTQSSPTGALDALKKAGKVTKIGDETIGGEQTTHYRAVVDFSRSPNGKRLEQLAHLTAVPVDVWIGSDGLLRRLTESFSETVAGQTTTTQMTMSFSNYGEQVSVQVPPADQTIDMTKLGG